MTESNRTDNTEVKVPKTSGKGKRGGKRALLKPSAPAPQIAKRVIYPLPILEALILDTPKRHDTTVYQTSSDPYSSRHYEMSLLIAKTARQMGQNGAGVVYAGPCTGKTFLTSTWSAHVYDTDYLLTQPDADNLIKMMRDAYPRMKGKHKITQFTLDHDIAARFAQRAVRGSFGRLIVTNLPIRAEIWNHALEMYKRPLIRRMPCLTLVDATELRIRLASRSIFLDVPSKIDTQSFMEMERDWIATSGLHTHVQLPTNVFVSEYIRNVGINFETLKQHE